MKLAVGILGAGSWGTAIAQSLAQKENLGVTLWDRSEKTAQSLQNTRINQKYFPEHNLESRICITSHLGDFIKHSDIIIIALPTSVIPFYIHKIIPALTPKQIILNASKGLDHNLQITFSQMITQKFGVKTMQEHYGVLSGPSFALEVMNQKPTGLTLALSNPEIAQKIKEQLHQPLFQIFPSQDVLGVEIGGALKNVIAITVGASDTLNFGLNTRAALLTKGIEEISQIGVALGASKETFWGLSGIGDLILTCTGDLSRNRRVGVQLAQGKSIREVLKSLGQIAEGIRTTKTAYRLAQKFKMNTPILQETYRAIFEGKPLTLAVETILQEMK